MFHAETDSFEIHQRVSISRGYFVKFLIFVGCFIVKTIGQSTNKQPPHIVLFLADDLGWNDVSFHGSKQIPTPNVDALARDGVILNQKYAMTFCSPSRGSLMTGKYPIQLGLQTGAIKATEPYGLPLNETTLPQYMKALNYSTHMIGKWDLGYFNVRYTPYKRGFDTFFGYFNSMENYFSHNLTSSGFVGLDLHFNDENLWQYNGTYGPDLYTAQAKKIIQEHDPEKPLFLYVAQQCPHSGNTKPLEAPWKYVEPMVGIENQNRRIFAGMVSSMDYSVGEIFEALEINGMLDNTIFIFSSDNGGSPNMVDGSSGSNWPLKGCKTTSWEGGVRVVSFIWSPFLRQRSRIYNGLMHIIDWLPTILSASGGQEALSMLPNSVMGVDQWPSIAYGYPHPRSEILLDLDGTQKTKAIRKDRFKLVKGMSHNYYFNRIGEPYNSTKPPEHLFEKDIIYTTNYMRFLEKSKVANILFEKYGRDPLLAASCFSSECEELLEIKCGIPGREAMRPFCNDSEKACLYDIESDPCEYHNIAQEFPEITAALEEAIDKYRAIAIPPGNKPEDPAANPALHGGVWVPWIP